MTTTTASSQHIHSPEHASGKIGWPWIVVAVGYFVPGVIGTVTLITIVNLTAFAIVREREVGTLEQILVTPIRPVEFIIGKTLPFFLIGLLVVLIAAVAGSLCREIPV